MTRGFASAVECVRSKPIRDDLFIEIGATFLALDFPSRIRFSDFGFTDQRPARLRCECMDGGPAYLRAANNSRAPFGKGRGEGLGYSHLREWFCRLLNGNSKRKA